MGRIYDQQYDTANSCSFKMSFCGCVLKKGPRASICCPSPVVKINHQKLGLGRHTME